jgi:hypothetical protein
MPYPERPEIVDSNALRKPRLNGHFIINDRESWESAMDSFIDRL